ncbi:unnamed protein product [Protopolystoma xenopodis]|uniref:Uncharacterized protein n=1 Tax=Protopolystoma xenopodis TaxID=117903 RepID=A0A3S5CMD3_9PLAT|nr:unnamed protein product [Protopolystoma xenopodis]
MNSDFGSNSDSSSGLDGAEIETGTVASAPMASRANTPASLQSPSHLDAAVQTLPSYSARAASSFSRNRCTIKGPSSYSRSAISLSKASGSGILHLPSRTSSPVEEESSIDEASPGISWACLSGREPSVGRRPRCKVNASTLEDVGALGRSVRFRLNTRNKSTRSVSHFGSAEDNREQNGQLDDAQIRCTVEPWEVLGRHPHPNEVRASRICLRNTSNANVQVCIIANHEGLF